MTPIQQKMLDLLLEVDQLCNQHGIPYYLAGGSVLGAVRHRGFIPWDDDIDIMMTRPAFKAFEALCGSTLLAERELITNENTPCHTKVTIKYMDKTTTQLFRSQVLDTTGCGISLDIFVLDPLPRNERQKRRHIAEYVVYNELLTPFFMVNDELHHYIPLYRHYAYLSHLVGKKNVMRRLHHRLFTEELNDFDEYLYRWGQQLLIYDRSLFGDTPVRLPFEGHLLPVPERTLDFLRATYGDGWKLLPKEQDRQTHVSDISLTVPYRNILLDMQQFIPRNNALTIFCKRKRANIKKMPLSHSLEEQRYCLMAVLADLELHADPNLAEERLTPLLEQGDDQALLSRFDRYYKIQLQHGMLKSNTFVPISDELLVSALFPLIRTDGYLLAEKILELREQQEHPLSPRLTEIRMLIDGIRSGSRALEDGCYEKATQIIAPLYEQYPENLHLLRCHLCLLLHTADETALRAAIPVAEAGLRRFPLDSELAYLTIKIYMALGNTDSAKSLMPVAAQTNSGMLLLELESVVPQKEDSL